MHCGSELTLIVSYAIFCGKLSVLVEASQFLHTHAATSWFHGPTSQEEKGV